MESPNDSQRSFGPSSACTFPPAGEQPAAQRLTRAANPRAFRDTPVARRVLWRSRRMLLSLILAATAAADVTAVSDEALGRGSRLGIVAYGAIGGRTTGNFDVLLGL